MRSLLFRSFFMPGVVLAFTFMAAMLHAQTAPVSSWARVQALKPGTKILLKATSRHGSCVVKRIDADSITCASGDHAVVARTEVTEIKMPHRGRSALIGLGAGAGIGAIVGAATTNDSGQLVIVSKGAAATVFGVLFGVVGALIGALTDFARTTLYRA